MTKTSRRWIAMGTLAVVTAGSFGLGSTPAQAGSKQRKNLTIGAAAVTAYGLLTHRRGLAVAGAVGTAVGYHNYRAAQKRENRQREAALARQRYYSRTSSRRNYSVSPYYYSTNSNGTTVRHRRHRRRSN